MSPRRVSPLSDLAHRIVAQVGTRQISRPILIVGAISAGKTSTGLRLLSMLRRSGIRVGGFLAPRILEGDETIGYSLIDLSTNATHPFAGLESSDVRIGRFFISSSDLATADHIVASAVREASVVMIDEVGRLELNGQGHAPAVRRLLASRPEVIPILLVRDELVDAVVRAFDIENPLVFQASDIRNVERTSAAGAQTFWEIVDSVPYPLLVTVHPDGYPRSRPMHIVERDTASLWFATSLASRKIAQIKENPHVTVLFVDSARFNYASVDGDASVVVDVDKEQKLWREDWRDDWPNGPADPDYVLLRIDALRGHYIRGSTGESGVVNLRQSEAA